MVAGRIRGRAKATKDWRMKAVRIFFGLFAAVIGFRLFTLQILNAEFYQALASGQHSFYQELFAERGDIYVKDWGSDAEFLAATNEPRAFVYADPRRIEDPEVAARELSLILGYDVKKSPKPEEPEVPSEPEKTSDTAAIVEALAAELAGEVLGDVEAEPEVAEEPEVVEEGEEKDGPSEYELLLARLSKEDDPYEPVARNVPEETLERILDLDLDGIDYVLQKTRSYPETQLGGHVFGFVGNAEDGSKVGYYGLEGYFDEFLSGENGFLDSETDASGRWIGVGSRTFKPAKDGGDLLLTIDRTVQYVACQKLAEGVDRFDADGGTLVIMEPNTGAIIAMCNVPDFDPNIYNEVEDGSVYNNHAINTPYEVGSVFKPLIMAAAIDLGAVTPTTTYDDTGEEEIEEYTIRNSDLDSHGISTMTYVLEQSLNTGMIFVMRQMGMEPMRKYIEDFGFGKVSGVELNTERAGNLRSLDAVYEIFYATASYGQGITGTALQLASAYSAIANGGALMEPYVVQEMRHSDGTVDETKPHMVRQVLSKKTATTVGAMMVSVVENGHGNLAAVPGYYIAGKTGTAQVAKERGLGYQEDYTKATFAGFGPVEDPVFTMVVMLDRPRAVPWAADTSTPIFGEIAEFLMQYYQVPPTREVVVVE